MRLLPPSIAMILVFVTLGCSGLVDPMPNFGEGEVDTIPTETEAGVVPPPEADPASSWISGRWCEEDPEVGCYRFEGNVVYEEAVKTRSGRKPATEGTWTIEEDMLLMRFPEGTWSLQILKRTKSILVLKDYSQDDTYNFVRD